MEPGEREKGQEQVLVEEERWELLERISRWLDQPMAILALIWVALLIVQLTEPLPREWQAQIEWLDIAIWIAFLAQFLLELIIAPRKVAYIRGHWITALSVVLPFFRVVRLVQALRALRSISLVRVVLGANRATRAAALFFGRHRFQYVLALVTIATLAGAAGAYAFERGVPGSPFDSFGTALWWSATMITTINVGIEPVTLEGRVIAILIRVVALALFGYIAGSVASYLVQRGVESRAGQTGAEPAEGAAMAEEVRALRRQLVLLQRSIEDLRQELAGRAPSRS